MKEFNLDFIDNMMKNEAIKNAISMAMKGKMKGIPTEFAGIDSNANPELLKKVQRMIRLHIKIKKLKSKLMKKIGKKGSNFKIDENSIKQMIGQPKKIPAGGMPGKGIMPKMPNWSNMQGNYDPKIKKSIDKMIKLHEKIYKMKGKFAN